VPSRILTDNFNIKLHHQDNYYYQQTDHHFDAYVEYYKNYNYVDPDYHVVRKHTNGITDQGCSNTSFSFLSAE
jgi:hypothetical protein